MSESRGLIFNSTKYTLLACYGLNVIVCVIYVVVGIFTHVKIEEEVKHSGEHDSTRIIEISGNMLTMLGIIGIGLSWMGIYAVHKEIYKLNLWMSILSVIGLILTLISQSNPVVVVVHTIMTGCQIYFTLRIKPQQYSMDNNPELGKSNLNENTAMVLNAN